MYSSCVAHVRLNVGDSKISSAPCECCDRKITRDDHAYVVDYRYFNGGIGFYYRHLDCYGTVGELGMFINA